MSDDEFAEADRHLQGVLDSCQARGRLPGAVAATVESGELDWVGTTGTGEVSRQYRIGSITKSLTAVCVMQLADEARLDLDDELGRHLDGTAWPEVSVRQLLSHTAGLPSEPAGPWWERSTGRDLVALLDANRRDRRVSAPGDYFHYSNLGYGLLGAVVARLRDAPWFDVVRDRVLDPLAMSDTTYHPREPDRHGWSVDHLSGRLYAEPATDTGAMAPAGQLWSTVADLGRWLAFWQQGDARVLTRASQELMTDPVVDGYGLGLRQVDTDLAPLVGHTGSMPGFLAAAFTDDDTGVIFLADATTGVDPVEVTRALCATWEVPVRSPAPWIPTKSVPPQVEPLLGFWFWGNTATEWRWQDERLEVRTLSTGALSYTFEVRGDGHLVGVEGYHRGETLHVHPTHLECATFVYTRVPYDPAAPIPGPT